MPIVISPAPTSLPPSGTAGGNLTGTYPNPSVASGVIVNANVSASAAIAASKLSGVAAAPDPAQTARGIIAENAPMLAAIRNATQASQHLYGGLVPAYAGQVISGVAVAISGAAVGTAPTNIFVALYSAAGSRLAVSATLKDDAKWLATGVVSFAFTAAFTIVTTGGYYAALLRDGTFGATQPTLASYDATVTAGALGAGAATAVRQLAQATMPANATFITENADVLWLGLV